MKLNLPTLLGQQDFMSSNWDMIKSAQIEPFSKEQIEDNRKYASISMREIIKYCPMSDCVLTKHDIVNQAMQQVGEINNLKAVSVDLGSEDKFAFWQWMPDLKDAKIGSTLRIRLPVVYEEAGLIEDKVLKKLLSITPKVYTK